MPASAELHRFPQTKSVGAIRWVPSPSALHRLFAAALLRPSPCLEIHNLLSPSQEDHDRPSTPTLRLLSSWPSPAPISALRLPADVSSSAPVPTAAATLAASLHILLINPLDGSIDSELSVNDPSFHRGPISAVDLDAYGRECVTAGEDGRVNLVILGEGRLERNRVYDSKGLVGYTAARWGSPAEFATGGLGFGVQWWDQRRPGEPVAHFKGNRYRENVSGMVHSIDIHPSRKHICVVGGSCGTVFAWDLRWQQQPILLSGAGLSGTVQPASESEVWEVRYDSYTQSSSISSSSSVGNRILPVMMCSEDGILSVLEQGEEPHELLAEPCAINAFDIDPQNPSDVICALEWETIGILMRQKETFAAY